MSYWCDPHFERTTIGRFNPELALKKLQGKRLLFVGDSLQRNQWESFVCLVQGVIPEKKKSMKRGRVHSVFKAKVMIQWIPVDITSYIVLAMQHIILFMFNFETVHGIIESCKCNKNSKTAHRISFEWNMLNVWYHFKN